MNENTYLIVYWDINDEVYRRLVLQHFRQYKLLVADTAPTYRPYDKLIIHDGWRCSYRQAVSHGRLHGQVPHQQERYLQQAIHGHVCGHAPLEQERNLHHSLVDTHNAPWIYTKPLWPKARPSSNQATVVSIPFATVQRSKIRHLARRPKKLIAGRYN